MLYKLISDRMRSQTTAATNQIVDGKWLIPVISCDENGISHIRTETVDLQDKGDIGHLSEPIAVKSLKFRTTPSDYRYDWHTAPRKQFIVNLDAPVHITT